MNMTWQATDPVKLKTKVSQEINGVQAELTVSPYDIPQAVRGYRPAGTSWFTIELKYHTEGEPVKTLKHDDTTVVEIGVGSGRVYKIKFNLEVLNCKNVQLLVRAATNALTKLAHDDPQFDNHFTLAKRAVLAGGEQLFEAAVS